MSVGYIWSGLGLGVTDHGARAGSAAVGRKTDPGPAPVDYIWPKANVCWGSLVGAGVGSGYLVRIDVS